MPSDSRPALPPLLRLIWPLPGDPAPDAASLDWAEIDAMAAQHRLRPLLHQRLRQQGVVPPPEVLQRLEKAHRRSAAHALRQREEAMRLLRLLGEAGMAPVLLKGGALVWRGWFGPELRPMRDLDLLLPTEQAFKAHALLRASGYHGEEATPDNAGKHLPGLTSPDGSVPVEIHTELIEAVSPQWRERAAAFAEAALAHAEPLRVPPGALSLAPTELLLHVILHGVLDHQFNNGPLLLLDILALLEHGAIDWPRFWAEARASGGLRAAQLALRLAETTDPDVHIGWEDAEPARLSDETVAQAARMLLIDMSRKTELGAIGRIMRNSPADIARAAWGGLRRMVSRRERSTGAALRPDSGGLERLAATLKAGEDRRYIAATLKVSGWLRGE